MNDASAALLTRLRSHWQGRDDFTVLDTGFGDGRRWHAVRQAWRSDRAGPRRLHYVGLAREPVPWVAVRHGWDDPAEAAAWQAAWPLPLPGWHVVDPGADDVQLTLVFGDPATVVRRLDCRADAIDLTGFDPAGDAWAPGLLVPLARHAAQGALACGRLDDPALQAGLREAGFQVQPDALAAPFVPRGSVRRPAPRGGAPGHALVVGAGLAGAWASWALRRQGWRVTVMDRHPQPAQEASGNPAGLFHGTVVADDGPHARLHRAAALEASRVMAPWIRDGQVPGGAEGLLRLAAEHEPLATLQALLARHALPSGYAQALTADEASVLAGLPLQRPAWFYPGGGWVDPVALVRHLLAGSTQQLGAAVDALRRTGTSWQALDPAGQVVAEAETIVLANAAEAARLWPAAAWPVGRSRGQISLWSPTPAGAPRPTRPITGGGYLVCTNQGLLMCGATAAHGDESRAVRDADHRFNLDRLRRLSGWEAPWPTEGRVGWRATTPDRLPLVGPVPAAPSDEAGVPVTARWSGMARTPGLYVISGLGSRGLTWGPLLGRLLAAWVSGSPMPLAADLRDALDPARWQVRDARQGSRRRPSTDSAPSQG